jgi:hypothetical protein
MHSILLLVTSQAQFLLPTVRSRCVTLRFHPVGVEKKEETWRLDPVMVQLLSILENAGKLDYIAFHQQFQQLMNTMESEFELYAKQTQEAFGSMMQTYGKYYPYAFRTLVSLPEGQRIDASMQIAALHYGKPFLGDFLQAIKVPDSDYKLDPADRKALKQKLPVDNNFLSFGASMTSANPAATTMVTEFGQAIEKYATSLVARGKAASPSDAIKQASNLIIGQAYGFATIDDTPFAVKRQQGGTHLDDNDVASIQKHLSLSRAQMDSSNIDTSRFGFPAGISEETKKKSVQDTLHKDTFWVTNPANDGVVLFMYGMDGTTAPVKTKDGKQVETKFVDALSAWKSELQKRNTANYQAGGFGPL